MNFKRHSGLKKSLNIGVWKDIHVVNLVYVNAPEETDPLEAIRKIINGQYERIHSKKIYLAELKGDIIEELNKIIEEENEFIRKEFTSLSHCKLFVRCYQFNNSNMREDGMPVLFIRSKLARQSLTYESEVI